MFLRPLVLGVVLSAAALISTAPLALADTWGSCSAHSAEDTTVRVFPRVATAHGPGGSSSELQCGNRFYGYQRIAPEWTGIPDWRATADAAIGHALSDDRSPTYDQRSDTWTYRAPGVIVTVRPRGLILDALPAAS